MGNDERPVWAQPLDDRQWAEVRFARLYASQFNHGTDGHSRLLLIDKLAQLLDTYAVVPTKEGETVSAANGPEGPSSTGTYIASGDVQSSYTEDANLFGRGLRLRHG